MLDPLANNLLGYDPAQLKGLLDEADLAAARKSTLLGLGQGLMASSGPSRMPINFSQAFAQATAQGQQMGQGSLQQAMLLRQIQQRKAQEQQAAQRQAALQDALSRGDIAAAAAIDPAYANQFRQATAVEPQKPLVLGRGERAFVDGRVVAEGLPPEAKEASKPEIKPIYSLDGKPLGNGLIDPATGQARLGNMALQPGQYTTEKPDNARASPAAMNLQNDLRDRLQKVAAAKRALENTKAALAGTKGVLFDTGPVDSKLDWTPSNNAFNAAVANLSPFIRSLTKTPGEGSVSDYEQKLQQMALPNQSNYYGVNESIIKNLEETIAGLESDYQRRLNQTGGGGSLVPSQGVAAGWSIEEVR